MPSHRKLDLHPSHSVSAVAMGMTASCPADIPAADIPMARPRRASNQRVTIVELVVSAIPPAPSAITTPTVA